MPRLQIKFGRQQTKLVALRLFQTFIVIHEIGAGIEHVLVEKQFVEFVADIIMVRNIGLGFANGIGLLHLAKFH